MGTTSRLEQLVLAWEHHRAQGQPLSLESLCRDCPNLKAALHERIKALEAMSRVLAPRDTNATVVPHATGGGVPGVPPMPSADLEPVAGYVLQQPLGSGGFGEVWQGVGPGGFPVALKFVALDGKAGPIEQRSLDILKCLRHPNLIAVFGAWYLDRWLMIAMELADETLSARLGKAQNDKAPGIPRDELLHYLRGAAEGIDYLNARRHHIDGQHDVAVVHRDIKPQNLLLVGGCVKVADFGLIRMLEHTVTSHTGSMTPAYAPPEFLRGTTAHTSDQYSLAVTYCQLRGGQLPFPGTAAQMMNGHLHRRPDLSMVPKEERAAVLRALAKNPADRWRSCKEFVERLAGATSAAPPAGRSPAKALAAKPGADKPVSGPVWYRRPRYLAMFGTVLITGSLGLCAVGFWRTLPRTDPQPATHPPGVVQRLATPPPPGPQPDVTLTGKSVVYLVDLKAAYSNEEFVQRDRLVVNGKDVAKGLMLHPKSNQIAVATYPLGRAFRTFETAVAINDGANGWRGSVTPLSFVVEGDGKILWRSRPLQQCRDTQTFAIRVEGVARLALKVECPGPHFCAHAVWVDPRLSATPAAAATPRPEK